MLKITLIVLAVIALGVGGILAYAATRPDDFRVQRSAIIKAPPEKIFPLINDFKHWATWSPYEKIDPAMKRTYGATTAGKGATYAWEGNNNVGSGSMEILNAPAPSKVIIKLDFMKPFEAHNIAEFTLMPSARRHQRHLGDARSGAVQVQDHPHVHEHGQDGRRPVRRRPREPKAAAEK